MTLPGNACSGLPAAQDMTEVAGVIDGAALTRSGSRCRVRGQGRHPARLTESKTTDEPAALNRRDGPFPARRRPRPGSCPPPG